MFSIHLVYPLILHATVNPLIALAVATVIVNIVVAVYLLVSYAPSPHHRLCSTHGPPQHLRFQVAAGYSLYCARLLFTACASCVNDHRDGQFKDLAAPMDFENASVIVGVFECPSYLVNCPHVFCAAHFLCSTCCNQPPRISIGSMPLPYHDQICSTIFTSSGTSSNVPSINL